MRFASVLARWRLLRGETGMGSAKRFLQGLRRQGFKLNRPLAQCQRAQAAINSGVAAGQNFDHSRIRQHHAAHFDLLTRSGGNAALAEKRLHALPLT